MKNSIDKEKIYSIALFGNPVKHSLSPLIHKFFSKDIRINYNYSSFLCTKANFEIKIKNFFKYGGFGCNITSPFKQKSCSIANLFSKQAKISSSINTLRKNSDGSFIGDNTDGIGLVYDLKRLSYIKSNTTVLLLGAGGVAYSIMYHLLKEGCCVVILNRTINNSINLMNHFKFFGKIFIFSDYLNIPNFDIIINATSSGLYNQAPIFPENLVTSKTKCYDISYSVTKSLTPFLLMCKDLGSKNISDGLGMLVAQAAYSCYFWFDILPNIDQNLNKLKLVI